MLDNCRYQASRGMMMMRDNYPGTARAGRTYTCPDCGRAHTVLWRGLEVKIACPCGASITVKPWARIGELFPWMRAEKVTE